MTEQGTGTALNIFTNVNEVEEFVKKAMFMHNITNPKDALPTCIDGRDKKPSNHSAMAISARPGGSAGELMTVLAVCNSQGIHDTEHVYNTYMDIVGGPQNFCFHTDDTHPEPGTGCGHLNKAREDSTAYGLEPDQIEFIFSKLPAIKQQGGEEEIRVGDHEEKGILKVRSKLWSVHPFSYGTQAFVINDTFEILRQEMIGGALYEEFSQKNPNLTKDDFIKGMNTVAENQLNKTAEQIAMGKPMFLVDIADNGDTSIEAL